MHPSDTSIEMHPCEHAFASPVSASHHRPFRLRIGVLKHFEGVLKLLQLLKLYYRKFRCMVVTKILNRKGCNKGCDKGCNKGCDLAISSLNWIRF